MRSTEHFNDINTAWILPPGLSDWSDASIQERAGSLWYGHTHNVNQKFVLSLITCTGLWIGVVIGLIAQVKYIYKEL